MPDTLTAVWISIEVGVLSTLLAAPFAIGVGYALARGQFAGKSIVSGLMLMPLVLPPVVTGLLLLDTVGRQTPLGRIFDALSLPLSFSRAACVLAAFITGFPLFVMLVRRTFEAIDPGVEDVARSLGLSRVAVFRRVTLPLAWPGLVAGATIAFARGLGEFGATTVLAGNTEGQTRTISLAVYTLLETPNGEAALRPLLFASVALSLVAVVTYEVLTRQWLKRLEVHHGR